MVPRLEAAANSDRSAKTGDEATILCKMTRQVFEGLGVILDYINIIRTYQMTDNIKLHESPVSIHVSLSLLAAGSPHICCVHGFVEKNLTSPYR